MTTAHRGAVMSARVSIIYYSATGNTHRLAQAIAEGASAAGAEVRLRTVKELAPPEAIASNSKWADHVAQVSNDSVEATLDDLEWATGVAFGSPTRFGLVSSQLKQFIDSTGPLWSQGKLIDKAMTAFTGASTLHGGHETTIASLYNVFVSWGAVIVPLGYTSPDVFTTGTPYGSSWTSGGGQSPDSVTLDVARLQGSRLARIADLISPVSIESEQP
jgi:NAD(P)H dehydrogenase (quinone)